MTVERVPSAFCSTWDSLDLPGSGRYAVGWKGAAEELERCLYLDGFIGVPLTLEDLLPEYVEIVVDPPRLSQPQELRAYAYCEPHRSWVNVNTFIH